MCAEQKRDLWCEKGKARMSKTDAQEEVDCTKSKRLNQNKNIDGQKAGQCCVKEWKVKDVPHLEKKKKVKIHFSFYCFSFYPQKLVNKYDYRSNCCGQLKQTNTKKTFTQDKFGKVIAHELDYGASLSEFEEKFRIMYVHCCIEDIERT